MAHDDAESPTAPTVPTAADGLPSFAALLARRDGRPPGTAWGVFGDDDEVGTINLLDADRVLAGVAAVRTGEVHSLNWRIDRPRVNPYRPAPRRVHLGAGGPFGRDDYVEPFYLQYSSQWDGLRHVTRAEGFYNGVPAEVVDAPDDTTLGIHHWAARGIVGRGVLLDVARHLAEVGRPLDPRARVELGPDALDATAAAQGVTIEPGDVLLVRTGWAGWYESLDPDAQDAAFTLDSAQPGLGPGEAVAGWLWDHHVAAAAADNTALEPMPFQADDGSLHRWLLPGFGMPIGEHFWLDGLAEACARDRRWTFLFTSAPLHVPGGVGSPPNALAIR